MTVVVVWFYFVFKIPFYLIWGRKPFHVLKIRTVLGTSGTQNTTRDSTGQTFLTTEASAS